MPNESSASASTTACVFRIDKFVVPADALPAFIKQMQHIQGAVHGLPGCQRDLLLTQTGGAGEFNVVRMIEWASAEAVAAAQAVVQKKFADEGFDPAAFVQRLGVRADLGFYSKA
ncbi:antibiotic biosynthesis monooxygenase [Polaromonas sp.]|uniref:antibiotic biosynthesis monooxygenase n=1 Tax=Polaromonas sp. TaxID=1869339 RepID=UPI002FC85B6C